MLYILVACHLKAIQDCTYSHSSTRTKYGSTATRISVRVLAVQVFNLVRRSDLVRPWGSINGVGATRVCSPPGGVYVVYGCLMWFIYLYCRLQYSYIVWMYRGH